MVVVFGFSKGLVFEVVCFCGCNYMQVSFFWFSRKQNYGPECMMYLNSAATEIFTILCVFLMVTNLVCEVNFFY